MKGIKLAAGLFMYRLQSGCLEIFLGHPGGPWYWNRIDACWQAPRGEVETTDKDLLSAARREFEEETGIKTPEKGYFFLGCARQRNGKVIYYWAFKNNWKGKSIQSNTFHMEYPEGTGDYEEFPELNDGKFFSVEDSRVRINCTLLPMLEHLILLVAILQKGKS